MLHLDIPLGIGHGVELRAHMSVLAHFVPVLSVVPRTGRVETGGVGCLDA